MSEDLRYYNKADYYNSDLIGSHYNEHNGSGFYIDTDVTHRDLIVSLHPNLKIKRNSDGSIDYKTFNYEDVSVSYEQENGKTTPIENRDTVTEQQHQWVAFTQDEWDEDGVSIFNKRSVSYPYAKKAILRSFVHDDFNVSVANSWSGNSGGDAVTDLFNLVKPYGAYLPFIKDQINIMKLEQDNLRNADGEYNKEVLGHLKNSTMADTLMKGVDTLSNFVNKDKGLFSKVIDSLNSTIVSQGSRFSYYQGTGTSFSHLNMKTTLFPKYDSTGKLITVLDQLEEIYPYAMGTFEHDEITSKLQVNKFIAWQRPPGGYEANIFDIDTVQKGTLKLKIGSMYSLDNLVISSMQLYLSKTVLKAPNPFKEIIKPTPLYCEVSIDLMPVTKYSVESLKDFVNGNRMKKCKIEQAKHYNNALEQRIDEISSLFGKGKHNQNGTINEDNEDKTKFIEKYETDADGKVKLDDNGDPIKTVIEVSDSDYAKYKVYGDTVDESGVVNKGGQTKTKTTITWTDSNGIAQKVYSVQSSTTDGNGNKSVYEGSVESDEYFDELKKKFNAGDGQAVLEMSEEVETTVLNRSREVVDTLMFTGDLAEAAYNDKLAEKILSDHSNLNSEEAMYLANALDKRAAIDAAAAEYFQNGEEIEDNISIKKYSWGGYYVAETTYEEYKDGITAMTTGSVYDSKWDFLFSYDDERAGDNISKVTTISKDDPNLVTIEYSIPDSKDKMLVVYDKESKSIKGYTDQYGTSNYTVSQHTVEVGNEHLGKQVGTNTTIFPVGDSVIVVDVTNESPELTAYSSFNLVAKDEEIASKLSKDDYSNLVQLADNLSNNSVKNIPLGIEYNDSKGNRIIDTVTDTGSGKIISRGVLTEYGVFTAKIENINSKGDRNSYSSFIMNEDGQMQYKSATDYINGYKAVEISQPVGECQVFYDENGQAIPGSNQFKDFYYLDSKQVSKDEYFKAVYGQDSTDSTVTLDDITLIFGNK